MKNPARKVVSMRWVALALVVLILIAAGSPVVADPGYSYRYRLHLALEIGGKAYSGSSVIRVSWSCGPHIADSGCAARLGGEAAVVDLESRGILVATLRTGASIFPVPDGAVDATILCASAFGNRSTREELPLLAKMSGRRNLSKDNFPRLVWFSDPADRGSARKVTLDTILEIDASARLLDAFVEITPDPIVVDIEKKLPWLPAMQREQAHLFISRPSPFHLVTEMFLGEDS